MVEEFQKACTRLEYAADICTNCVYTTPATIDGGPLPAA